MSMISSSSSIRKTGLSAASTSGICDQIERVRTINSFKGGVYKIIVHIISVHLTVFFLSLRCLF